MASLNRSPGALLPFCVALLLSACGGGGSNGGTPAPAPAPQPGSLQFEAGTLSIVENAGTASVTVTRTGGSSGAVSATLSSSDGSAIAGQDYTALNTTVSFAAGDASSKTVTISIADDAQGEGDEALTLTLSAPSGGASLGATSSAALTIRDNDPVLAVAGGIKQLLFTWSSMPGATSYRLLRDPDGASGFTQVGTDSAATATSASLDVAVHRHDWMNTRYRLDACTASGCSASNPVSAQAAMLQAIGYFKASNTGADDFFGYKVALSADGSTLAVAAHLEDSDRVGVDGDLVADNNDAHDAGAVYVFARSPAGWSRQAYIKAPNIQPDDKFGSALALSEDGSTLAVGLPNEDSIARDVNGNDTDRSAPDAGAAYVYTRVGTQWLPQPVYLKASNTDAGDEFGWSVALSADGNTLAVGAPGEDGNGLDGEENDGAQNAGAVYTFVRTGMVWSQFSYVKAPDADDVNASRALGRSVSLSADGGTLAVGAPATLGAAQSDPGGAFIFSRTANGWMAQARVQGSNTEFFDDFGSSICLSADGATLAVGAPFEGGSATGVNGGNDNLAPGAGAVYVFSRGGGLWPQQAYVKASNTAAEDTFGESIALSADGGILAVGASNENSNVLGVGGDQNNNSAEIAGAAYVFTRTAMQWSSVPKYVKASNTQARDGFGWSLALSGSGDTLVVGAPGEDSSATGVGGTQQDDSVKVSGAVYMY